MRKALTLVELMIAAALMTLIGAMVYLSFGNCIILNQFNRNRTIAITHAEYILEEIKNENFIGLEARIAADGEWDLATNAITALFDPNDDSVYIPLENEMIDTNGVDVSAGLDGSLLDVAITVSWTNRAGATRDIVLETLMAEP